MSTRIASGREEKVTVHSVPCQVRVQGGVGDARVKGYFLSSVHNGGFDSGSCLAGSGIRVESRTFSYSTLPCNSQATVRRCGDGLCRVCGCRCLQTTLVNSRSFNVFPTPLCHTPSSNTHTQTLVGVVLKEVSHFAHEVCMLHQLMPSPSSTS